MRTTSSSDPVLNGTSVSKSTPPILTFLSVAASVWPARLTVAGRVILVRRCRRNSDSSAVIRPPNSGAEPTGVHPGPKCRGNLQLVAVADDQLRLPDAALHQALQQQLPGVAALGDGGGHRQQQLLASVSFSGDYANPFCTRMGTGPYPATSGRSLNGIVA